MKRKSKRAKVNVLRVDRIKQLPIEVGEYDLLKLDNGSLWYTKSDSPVMFLQRTELVTYKVTNA